VHSLIDKVCKPTAATRRYSAEDSHGGWEVLARAGLQKVGVSKRFLPTTKTFAGGLVAVVWGDTGARSQRNGRPRPHCRGFAPSLPDRGQQQRRGRFHRDADASTPAWPRSAVLHQARAATTFSR